MRLFRREAGWLVGGLCVVALGASLVAVGFFHRALEQTEGEIAALRSEAERQTQTEAGRSAQDRALLEQLGRELAQTSAERGRAMLAVEAQRQLVAEQQSRIERLTTEREAAAAHAQAERARLIAERDAAVA